MSYARSYWGRQGERLWRANQADFRLTLSKREKLLITLYLIARDRAAGEFPRQFATTMDEAHRQECSYPDRLGDTPRRQLDQLGLTKPFWPGHGMRVFLNHFCLGVNLLSGNGINPPARILELGCGAGWLAELLARCGYDVMATTLDPQTVRTAGRRARAYQVLDIPGRLLFRQASMERIDESVADLPLFDAAIIYESLHHVHDWQLALSRTTKTLRPGGLLLIMNEPNLLHTLRAYRMAQLTQTRETGLSRRSIMRHLRDAGYIRVRSVKNRVGLAVRPIWIAATAG